MAILAMGQAFPILLRGIDLSIGAIVALVAMTIFDLSLLAHVPGYIVLPVALLVGVLAGALNGMLIVFLRLQPFIATLATLATYRGLVYLISGRQIVRELATTPITDQWIIGAENYFDIGGMLGITKFMKMPWFPTSFFAMLVLFVVFQGHAADDALRPRPLHRRWQYRSRAPGRHQHRPHHYHRLCHLGPLCRHRGDPAGGAPHHGH